MGKLLTSLIVGLLVFLFSSTASAQVTFTIGSQSANQGQQVCLPVTVSGFTNIIGAQFSINYDPTKLQFVSVGNFNLPGLVAANFGTPTGTPPTAAGAITFSWIDPAVTGVTVANGTAVFQLCFNVVGTSNATVSFSSNPTAIEITNAAGNTVPFSSVPGVVTVNGGGGGGGNTLTLSIQDVTASQGQQVCLDVSVQNFTNIVGAQFSINYNPALLQFVSIGSLNLSGLTAANFGTPTSTPPTTAGVITCSWIDPAVSGVTVANGTVIFEVCFNVVGNSNATVSFSNTPTAIEFTNSSNQTVTANTSDTGVVTVSGGGGGGGNTLTLSIQDVTATQGQQVCLDVSVQNFTNIVGAQFSINYNSSLLQFVSIGSLNLSGLTAANFGTPTSTPPTTAGVITCSWIDPAVSGVTVANGTVIFEVCFNVVGNSNATVSFSNTPTAIEFTNSSNQTVTANTSDTGVVTVSGGNGGGGGGNGTTPTFTGFGLVIADATATQGQQVCLDVVTQDFTNIVGMQYSMNYNPAHLQFVSVGAFNLTGLAAGNFGTPTGTPATSPGTITFSWVDPNVTGVTVANGTAIYEVCFNVLTTNCTDVTFTGTPTAIEVTDGNGDIVPFQSNSGTVGSNCGGNTGGGGGPGDDDFVVPAGTLGLNILDALNVQQGQQVCLGAQVTNFTNIVGAQFSINYNPAHLQFVSVGSFNLAGLSAGNFGTPTGSPATSPGVITFSWVDPNVSGVTVANDVSIFTICFNVIGTSNTDVTVTGTPTAIEITDGNGNIVPFQSDPGRVRFPNTGGGDPPVIQSTVTNVACRNESTGSIVLTVTGAGPFTYAWTPANIGNTASALNRPAGSYSVTVTDSQGLTASASFTITQPATAVTVAVTQQVDACFGQSNGSITVVASGGAGGYTYDWIPPGQPNTATISNLAPFDFYRVTVTDASGCKAISGFIDVDQLPQLNVAANVTNINCGAGQMTGSITLQITGGSGSYNNINWSGSLTDNVSTQSGLAMGTYGVTVTDNNGCTGTNSFMITQAGSVITVGSNVASNINNGNDGSINLTVSGGTGTLGYSWVGPTGATFNTQDLSGLNVPGQYCVTITDTGGSCPATSCVTLGENVRISSFEIVKTCNGGNNGSINITVTGGTGPYSYVWRNAANMVIATTQDVSGLTAGTFSVVVTDAQGQQITGSFDVTNLPAINVTASVNASTSGTNGSITTTVTGGQPGYTYVWNTGPTTPNLANLAPGQYCVTVTDGNGCTATQCFNVTATPFSVTSVVPGSVSCAGESDGTVTINVTGGTAPYTLVINSQTYNNGSGTFSVTGLPSGSLSYTLTDAQGTIINDVVSIGEPQPISVTPTVVHDSEDVGCTGSITLDISGGTGPYNVQWNTSAISPQIINLCEGVFIPQITDANGCVTLLNQGITVNTFTESGAVQNAICDGDANGSIDLSVSGGEGPYSFTWRLKNTTPVLATTEDLFDVAPGTYVVTIIEASGNTLTREYIVGAQSNIVVNASSASNYNGFAVSCLNAEDGLLVANATGGQGTYTFEWEIGGSLVGTGQQLLNAAAGEYILTVIDALNCEETTTFLATAPTAVTLDANLINISCPGVKDGSILVVASGGAGMAYNFSWSNNNIGPSLTFLAPGTYSVTVSDMNNCQNTASYEITEPTALVVTVATEPATEDCNGSAMAVVTGGSGSYNYQWLNAPSNTNARVINNLCPGDYFVQVTDSNGCESSSGAAFGTVEDRRFPCLDERVVITPDGNGTNDEFIIFCIGDLPDNHLEIYNRWGQLVFEVDDYDNTWEGTDQDGNPLPEGPYYYILEYQGPNGELIKQKGSITLLRD